MRQVRGQLAANRQHAQLRVHGHRQANPQLPGDLQSGDGRRQVHGRVRPARFSRVAHAFLVLGRARHYRVDEQPILRRRSHRAHHRHQLR